MLRWYVAMQAFSMLDWLLVVVAYRWMPHWFYIAAIVVAIVSDLGRAQRWNELYKKGLV